MRKTNPVNNRRNAIAQIHIGKKQLGLDNDTYRALLARVTGKSSCSDMDFSQLYKVIHAMEQQGWKKKLPAGKGKYSPKTSETNGQYIDVMRAIWIEMFQQGIVNDGSESGLTAYAKRMSSQFNGGIGVDTLEWLESDAALAIKVLECLKKWQQREIKAWQEADIQTIQRFMAKNSFTLEVAVKHLLNTCQIMYWDEFKLRLDIDNSPDFVTNRKELRCVE